MTNDEVMAADAACFNPRAAQHVLKMMLQYYKDVTRYRAATRKERAQMFWDRYLERTNGEIDSLCMTCYDATLEDFQVPSEQDLWGIPTEEHERALQSEG
jgi:hypothetical protein